MRVLFLICLPILMGFADTSLDHESINFIKKNEGYREIPYMDSGSLSVCYGNKYDKKKLIENRKYSKAECEKLIYNHYFNKIKPNVPMGLNFSQKISVADTLYQYGENAEITHKRIKSYPERGRWELYSKNETGWIY